MPVENGLRNIVAKRKLQFRKQRIATSGHTAKYLVENPKAEMREVLKKLYYWFWHDVCKRPEPFTYTMRRSFKKHPLPWILTPIGIGVAWYLLVIHLGGFI